MSARPKNATPNPHHAMKYTARYTGEASPLVAEESLTRQITHQIETALPLCMIEWIEPLDVREGAEKCGMGEVTVSGRVRAHASVDGKAVAESRGKAPWIDYTVTAQKGEWRNHHRGTTYDITALIQHATP